MCLLELSNMPIADLLQLKERLGTKMYVSDLFAAIEQHFRPIVFNVLLLSVVFE